jgi:hypothetical protein
VTRTKGDRLKMHAKVFYWSLKRTRNEDAGRLRPWPTFFAPANFFPSILLSYNHKQTDPPIVDRKSRCRGNPRRTSTDGINSSTVAVSIRPSSPTGSCCCRPTEQTRSRDSEVLSETLRDEKDGPVESGWCLYQCRRWRERILR